uniref:Uncharacterized protein n=1 Tax=Rhizophora mucronata TaxID=61149 RepID=A0A2P2JLL7_RHIMU
MDKDTELCGVCLQKLK